MDSVALACRIRATSPATSGAAIEVPFLVPNPPPGNDDRMSTPGALTSGLISSHGDGPRLENRATRSCWSVAPTAKDSR